MNFLIMDELGTLSLVKAVIGTPSLSIAIEPFSNLGDGVEVKARFIATDSIVDIESLKLELIFQDQATGDSIYTFTGTLDPDLNTMSGLTSIIDATEEFATFDIQLGADFFTAVKLSAAFNPINTLGRNSVKVDWVSDAPVSNVDKVHDILTQATDKPTRLYMYFTDNVPLYMQLLRVSDTLNIRLFVEFDPMLTVDQVIQIANDLKPMDHRVTFIWSPNLARPINAQTLRGKKVGRLIGGKLMSEHTLRDARTNSLGIPPYQDPIAGYDYPFTYLGLEKRRDVVLDDPTRKRLAKAQINVMQPVSYRAGTRFILGDVITANGDPTALLQLINSSDIAMFIDNTINAITLRHLLKGMDTYINDATRECTRFLESCCTKERPLLVHSETLGGYFDFSITPRQDRPFDAVDIRLGRRPQGAVRAGYVDSSVVK